MTAAITEQKTGKQNKKKKTTCRETKKDNARLSEEKSKNAENAKNAENLENTQVRNNKDRKPYTKEKEIFPE